MMPTKTSSTASEGTSAHVRLSEWRTLTPEYDPVLAGLALSAADRSLAQSLSDRRMLFVQELRSGLRLQSTSFVGRIELSGAVVTIEPKLAPTTLLRLVRYAYGLRDLETFNEARVATTGALFADLLIAQLLAEATELLDRGLQREYVEQRDELLSPRGRIDMSRLAQRGLISAVLPCRHHPRLQDTELNQILLGGLALAAQLASSPGLRIGLHRLMSRLTPTIQVTLLTAERLSRVRRSMNRLVAHYESAIRLIAIIYEGTSICLDDQRQTLRLPGFMFDMNRFFQALLLRFLREHLGGGLEVAHEYGLNPMFRYLPEANPRKRLAPRPRPDFAVKRDAAVLAILDAKYRDLWERPLPRDMLYQLTLYALSQGTHGTAAILYPTDSAAATEARVEFSDPVGRGHRNQVCLRPVQLDRLAELAESGRGPETSAFARHLAFG